MKILLTTLAAAFLALSVGGAVQASDRHDKHQDHSSRDRRDKDRDRDDRRDYDRDHDRKDRDHWREYDSWYYEQYGRSFDRDNDGGYRIRPLDRK
jgi:Ni/Co efflux regulator RcnB